MKDSQKFTVTTTLDGHTVEQSRLVRINALRALGFRIPLNLDDEEDERYEGFKDGMREAMLGLLDQWAGHIGLDKGWRDVDLPELFKALDKHASRMWVEAGQTKR